MCRRCGGVCSVSTHGTRGSRRGGRPCPDNGGDAVQEHDLLATSWTWAGSDPVDARIRAVGAAGFAGLSLTLGDLHEVRATIGFAELRRVLDGAGIVWVQLGPLERWWTCSARTEEQEADRGVVLEAAVMLGAWQVVVRADTTLPGISPAAMVDDWIELAGQAAK